MWPEKIKEPCLPSLTNVSNSNSPVLVENNATSFDSHVALAASSSTEKFDLGISKLKDCISIIRTHTKEYFLSSIEVAVKRYTNILRNMNYDGCSKRITDLPSGCAKKPLRAREHDVDCKGTQYIDPKRNTQ